MASMLTKNCTFTYKFSMIFYSKFFIWIVLKINNCRTSLAFFGSKLAKLLLTFGGHANFFPSSRTLWVNFTLFTFDRLYNSATIAPFDLQNFWGILSTLFQQFINIISASEVFRILKKFRKKIFFWTSNYSCKAVVPLYF